MVTYTGKTPSTGSIRSMKPGTVDPDAQLRLLNLPVPIEVIEDSVGRPAAITIPLAINSGLTRLSRLAQQQRTNAKIGAQKITAINDLWQVNDEWWREHPVSRRYYQITTQSDRRLTIFKDDLNGNWYCQKGE